MAGLLSCLRSKGSSGPVLLVAPSSSHAPWRSMLESKLGPGEGLLLHAHTAAAPSPRACEELAAFCRQAGRPGHRVAGAHALLRA